MESENRKMSFTVQSFRKIPNPYATKEGGGIGDANPQMYIAICDVTNLPDDIPMKTNPRKQKLTTAVAKKIKSSLLDQGMLDFYLLNRGLLLSAESATFNNYNNELTIVFADEEVHGDVDGGHTYEIIKQYRDEVDPGTQYVKLEILCGVESIFTQLAAARNTSVQVKDASIAELENKFEIIKQGVGDEGFFDDIYFTENDEGSIDVQDILAILNIFNIDRYPTSNMDSFPKTSYTSRKNCVDYYLKTYDTLGDTDRNPYVKMMPIMADIFKLYDQIERKIPEYYSAAFANGRYGATKGVSTAKSDDNAFDAKFSSKKLIHSTPTGFIYPILGSLRAALEEDGSGHYRWKNDLDPFELLNEVGPELVSTTIERSRTLGGNPNAVGKDTGNWKTLFMTVAFHLMQMN